MVNKQCVEESKGLEQEGRVVQAEISFQVAEQKSFKERERKSCAARWGMNVEEWGNNLEYILKSYLHGLTMLLPRSFPAYIVCDASSKTIAIC